MVLLVLVIIAFARAPAPDTEGDIAGEAFLNMGGNTLFGADLIDHNLQIDHKNAPVGVLVLNDRPDWSILFQQDGKPLKIIQEQGMRFSVGQYPKQELVLSIGRYNVGVNGSLRITDDLYLEQNIGKGIQYLCINQGKVFASDEPCTSEPPMASPTAIKLRYDNLDANTYTFTNLDTGDTIVVPRTSSGYATLQIGGNTYTISPLRPTDHFAGLKMDLDADGAIDNANITHYPEKNQFFLTTEDTLNAKDTYKLKYLGSDRYGSTSPAEYKFENLQTGEILTATMASTGAASLNIGGHSYAIVDRYNAARGYSNIVIRMDLDADGAVDIGMIAQNEEFVVSALNN